MRKKQSITKPYWQAEYGDYYYGRLSTTARPFFLLFFCFFRFVKKKNANCKTTISAKLRKAETRLKQQSSKYEKQQFKILLFLLRLFENLCLRYPSMTASYKLECDTASDIQGLREST